MIKQWQFWVTAMIAGPVAWVVLVGGFLALKKQVKAVRRWYYGLPIYYYPAMLLIILGARHLSKKHCEWKKLDGRLYFTVYTQGFNPESEDEK